MKKITFFIVIIALFLGIVGIKNNTNAQENAKTDATTHLVAFDPDNGSGYGSWFKTEVNNGGLITEKPSTNPTKDGHIFNGWYSALDENNNPILWDFANDKVYENTTLWPAFSKIHTVTYDPDDGSGYNSWFKTEVINGELITEKPSTNPTKDGYIFKGWFYALDENNKPILWDFAKDRVYDNTTLWPAFSKIHTVTYDPDDGSGYGSWFHTPVADGELVKEKPSTNPTKEGYIFDGWYRALDENNKPIFWDFAKDKVYENTTLWPAFSKAYKVTFNPQNGSDESTWQTISVKENSLIAQNVKVPKKSEHELIGWSKSTDSLDTWDFNNERVNSDIMLYAQWKEKKYEVKPTSKDKDNNANKTNNKLSKDKNNSKKNNAPSLNNGAVPITGMDNILPYIVLLVSSLAVGGYMIIRRKRLH